MFILFINSCEDDTNIAPGEFSDVTWYTSVYPGQPLVATVGGFVAFTDLSQGALSHEWTIDEGNYFLKNGFTKNDTILDSFIDNNQGLVSLDKTINVLFKKAGLQKVRLYDTFKDSVTYVGKTFTLKSKREGNVFVIDTTFVVDVFDSIKPAFKVTNSLGVTLLNVAENDKVSLQDTASWPTVTIEAGEKLTFNDLTTTGKPTSRNWNIPGGKTTIGNAAIATYSFFKIGYFKGASIAVSRTDPAGSVSKLIPIKINVIPSTKPFVFDGNLTEGETEVISFNVTGEVATILGAAADFTVQVSNAGSGFNSTIKVKSVAINGSDATKLELTLESPIYNTDVIKVSFASGKVISVDGRTLSAFTTETVKPYYGVGILSPSGYGVENNAAGWWFQHPAYWSASGDQAATGSYSLKFTCANNTAAGTPGRIITYAPSPGAINAGDYLVKAKVYKVAGCTVKSFNIGFEKNWVRNALDISTLADGKWSEVTRVFTQPSTKSPDSIFIDVNGPTSFGGGIGTFYIDDIQCIPLEKRP